MPQRPGEFSSSKIAGRYQRVRPVRPRKFEPETDVDGTPSLDPGPDEVQTLELTRPEPEPVRNGDGERWGRRELVAELRAQGCSLRVIADRLGISHETVRADLTAISRLTPRRLRRRAMGLERLAYRELERGTVLYADENANLYSDPELHRPLGLAACRTATSEVDDPDPS